MVSAAAFSMTAAGNQIEAVTHEKCSKVSKDIKIGKLWLLKLQLYSLTIGSRCTKSHRMDKRIQANSLQENSSKLYAFYSESKHDKSAFHPNWSMPSNTARQ